MPEAAQFLITGVASRGRIAPLATMKFAVQMEVTPNLVGCQPPPGEELSAVVLHVWLVLRSLQTVPSLKTRLPAEILAVFMGSAQELVVQRRAAESPAIMQHCRYFIARSLITKL